MKFADPLWLLAGVAVVAFILWSYRRFDRRQRAALADFASAHLIAQLTSSFSPGRRRLKRALFLIATALVFIALARPQWGYHWEERKQRGIDILFAIDTSKSMLTQDVEPNRLTRARLAVTDLVRKLDGDRVGLIAFAGDAFLQAPLTIDYDAFQESLDAVDVGVVPRGGTDIGSAIQEAQAAFAKENQNRKILVLITDGEDLEARGIDAARAAARDGLTIYTIGVGSPSGGLIPVTNADGGTDFLKDDSGQYVKSRLDESALQQIAQATGGIYEPLGQKGEGLDTLYRDALAKLPKQDLASRSQRVYEERFQWPLGAGLFFLIGSLLIGTARRNPARVVRKAAPVAAAASFVALMTMATGAHASPQSAEQAYKKGDFPAAEKQYAAAADQNPQAAPLQFNLGAAAYKNDEFDKALPAFQKALETDQPGMQEVAYYNIGNTQYRLGQKTEKSSPQDTISTWQNAVQAYDAALKLKPDDADAKFNRDFVQKKLDQLQQQKQQQQQNQQNQQDKNQDQQNQQNQSQQNPNQQSQDQNKDQQAQNQQNQNQQGQDKNQQAQNQQNQNQQGQGKNQQQTASRQNSSSGSQQDQAQNDKSGQQNQQQSQANAQQQQNQNGQPQDQLGQQQTAGNQNQNSPQNGNQDQQGNANSSLAQNGEKPAGPRGETIPDKNSGKQQDVAANEAETGTPEEMTPEQARDLLNSLKNGEHALPVTADARNSANHPPDQQPFKDW